MPVSEALLNDWPDAGNLSSCGCCLGQAKPQRNGKCAGPDQAVGKAAALCLYHIPMILNRPSGCHIRPLDDVAASPR